MGTALRTARPPTGQPVDATISWTRRGWLTTAAALLTFVLIDVLRVWLPSIVHVYGSAGSTPATRMGAFAAIWFLLPVVPALAVRAIGPARLWRFAVPILLLARIWQQLTDGGSPQLWATCLGVVAGVTALVALAAGGPSGHLARVGIVVGLAVSTFAHAVLETVDLTWRTSTTATVVVVTGAVVVWLVAERARRVPLWWPTAADAGDELTPVWTRGSAWPWLGVGPAIALVGILVASPVRLELAAGWSPREAVLALAFGGGLAIIAATLSPALGAPVMGTIGAVTVLVATLGALRPEGLPAALSQVALLVAIGATLGASGTSPRDSGPRRRGAAAAGSMLLFFLVGFLYYASYELSFGLQPRAFLLLSAVVLAALSGLAARKGRAVRPTGALPVRTVVTTLTVALVAAVVGLATVPAVPAAGTVTSPDGTLRIATFNVRMGYDLDGRFDPAAIAAVLRDEQVDVVVLNEVDRGWLLNGGHDVLRLLAADLEMPQVQFGPAADDVWGNAVLSRFPLRDARVEPLPRGGAAMHRSLVSVVVEVGADRYLGLVGTHLHHVTDQPAIRLTQARAVAAEASRLRARGLPVAVLGDLNAAEGTPELEPLDWLVDAVPGGAPTFPADVPLVQLDHILVSEDLIVEQPTIPQVAVSDHLPVIVTLHTPARQPND